MWRQLSVHPETLAGLTEAREDVRAAASKGARTSGTKLLFRGEAGTGKASAVAAMAETLGLTVMRVDLAQVESKSIGETEKNLIRVLDQAEAGGALLFLDEADALFGERTEVKGSAGRFANVASGSLLQRLEGFDGVAIVATSSRSNIDPAWARRFGRVIEFLPRAPG